MSDNAIDYGLTVNLKERFKSRLYLLYVDSGCKCISAYADKIGITRQAMTNYIKGDNLPDYERLLIICQASRVSADWLMGLERPIEKTYEGLDGMPSREKVIRGLECCNKTGRERYLGGCERCPYYDHGDPLDCRARLDLDALDLLVDDEIREEGTDDAESQQPNENAEAHDA